jgi:DNA mismatch repair protein MutH
LVAVVLAPILGAVGYTWFSLSWSYSDGERAGVLQKLSSKGWVCKTWEGELAVTSQPGSAPVIWNFTVRDDEVVQAMNDAMGKQVVLGYSEHTGIPSSCFGETPYFVHKLELQK